MPQKSIKTTADKRTRTVVKREVVVKEKCFPYKTLADLNQYIAKLKCMEEWTVCSFPDKLVLTKIKLPWKVPEITILINDGFEFTILVFDWFLPEDHILYKTNKRSLKTSVFQTL